jgi:rare lipoprotein A
MLARRVAVLGVAVVALFVVLASFAGPGRAEQLVASWYGVGDGFAGQTTANGEIFDPYAYTAAHKTLPFDTKLEVTYGGESVVVRINDRGPYIQGRDIDLSYAAADEIGLVAAGSAPVEVEYVDAATPVGPVGAAAAPPAPQPAPEPAPEPVSESPAQETPRGQDSGSPASAEPSEDSAGVAQYPAEEGAAEEQYVDASQYAEESAAQDQYGVVAPAVEPTVEPEDLPASPPATIAPPVEELEEPPAELVKPGSTVEHRIELKVAAKPGTATDSPDTPELAPEPAEVPVDDLQASGDVPEAPEEPAAAEAKAPSETADEAPEVEQSTETGEEQEIQIERLPDTGGPAILPEIPVTELIAVALFAVLLHGGFRRVKG